MKRILTALVLVPTVMYLVLGAPQWLFLAAVAIVASLCFYEYLGIAGAYYLKPPAWLGFAAGLLVLLFPKTDVTLLSVVTLLILAAALREDDFRKSLLASGVLLLGVLYIFGTWRCGILLRAVHPGWMFFALALNWVGDTMALYTGRAFGKHKLAPLASPKKTWEGAFGSLAGSVLFGVLFLPRWLDVPVGNAILLAALAGIAGQVGDLAESVLKRGAGVKDSGSLLPGHGGWLDRVDSSLFSMPVVCLYLNLPNYQ